MSVKLQFIPVKITCQQPVHKFATEKKKSPPQQRVTGLGRGRFPITGYLLRLANAQVVAVQLSNASFKLVARPFKPAML